MSSERGSRREARRARGVCREPTCGQPLAPQGCRCPKHREENILYLKRWRSALRDEVRSAYGGKCCFCGYKGRALDVDHIHGDGQKKNASFRSGTSLWRWLKVRGYPEGFQLLCRNCNWEKYLESDSLK